MEVSSVSEYGALLTEEAERELRLSEIINNFLFRNYQEAETVLQL